MKLRDANLQVNDKNSSQILLHVFCLHFLRTHHITSKSLLKSASKIFCRKYEQKVVLLVIYLLNYDWSKSTSFMLNMAFDFVLSTVFVKQMEAIAIHYKDYKNSQITNCQPVFWYVVLFDRNLIVPHHGDNTFLFCFDICTKTHFRQ